MTVSPQVGGSQSTVDSSNAGEIACKSMMETLQTLLRTPLPAMTGSRPQKMKKVARRRAGQPPTPWPLVGALFGLYSVVGLLLSVPLPPYWLWAPAVVGTLLLVLGLNPSSGGDRTSWQGAFFSGLMTYVGGLLLAIALAIAVNYIGGDNIDDIGFVAALVWLAFFILLAVILTAAAAILNALAGERMSWSMAYSSRLMVLLGSSLGGIALGGVIGFSMATLSRVG
ncbi:MAG: hypothetical protein AAF171_12725 [Cyanobacteria bacterium P01_A01_bin.116]